MVPGLAGHLVSEVFLETHVLPAGAFDGGRLALDRARLAQLRHQAISLGPASSLRALLEIAAAPLVELVGFEPPTDVERVPVRLKPDTTYEGGHVDHVFAATIVKAPGPHPRRSGLKAARADSQNVALLVAGWNERLDPLWRLAVTQAALRLASWCGF